MQRGFTYVNRIAELMDADPSIVFDVLRLSYEQRALFHGVKCSESAEKIRIEGVRPLTPESGMASHWTKGVNLFINPDFAPGSIGETLDNSFTNYAHVRQRDYGGTTTRACLVVTDYDNLNRQGIANVEERSPEKLRPDGEVTIKQVIPSTAIDIIDVTADEASAVLGRERGKYVERSLLYALHRALKTFPDQRRGRLVTRGENGLYVVEPLLQIA